MRVVVFRYFGKYGHFLRAEANANGITYPFPPRTSLLGMIGAVLGMEKDEPQIRLSDASVAISGLPPQRFWHKTNIRKIPPAMLPDIVKAKDEGPGGKKQRNFRFPQEWLWRPDYRVWAALPANDHASLASRLRERRWHFTPSLGLAFLFAHLEFISEFDAEQLPDGEHEVVTVSPYAPERMPTDSELGLVSLRMPAAATADRVFRHKAYWFEYQGRPFPVKTTEAWQCGADKVVFL